MAIIPAPVPRMSFSPLRRSACLFLLLWCSAGMAVAQQVDLYEGEAPVDSQSAEHRAAALPRALAQVLVKVSGDPGIASSAVGLSEAASLMQRYRYRQDTVMQNGVPTLKTVLIAQFDRSAVDAMVGRSGHAVWPSPRPRPILWLAIDDGRGARLVGEAQASAVAALVRRGSERGLGFSFPQADLQDQTVGGADAIWRNDFTAVRNAAARYGAAPVLVGKMQRGAGGWTADWALLDGGTGARRWSATDADATVVLAAGADGTASSLARGFVADIMSGPAGDYDVVVTGLTGANDYGRVMQYLQALPIVQTITVTEVAADQLGLKLGLRAGVEGLVRLVERGGVLKPVPAAGGSPPAFALQP
jgi:hypothetical protein